MELSNPQLELSNPQLELSNPQLELSNPQLELSNPHLESSFEMEPTVQTVERPHPIHRRRILSLKDKGKIIEEVDRNPHLSKVKLAEKLELPTSTLATILTNRESIMKTIAKCGSASSKRKNARTSPYQYLEDKLLDWLIDRQEKGYPINSVIIREQAKTMAVDLGLEAFTASSGWIDRFKNRHGLGNRAVFDASVAECKNRWALVRDSFPEQTGPVRKKRPKETLDEASYIQSIYEPSNAKLLGNASAETTSSQLMPLENSPWPVNYPNFPDHHHSSDPDPNIHIPEVKLEVGTFDEEDRNKAVYDPTTRHNNSDFSYIVPNSFDQSAVSSQRTSAEPNGAVVSAKPKQDQATTEPEVVEVNDSEARPSDHPIETFFKSMAATVMTFPPHLMAVAKLNVCKLITELELRALSERNRFEASQERINEMLSENIVETSSTSSK